MEKTVKQNNTLQSLLVGLKLLLICAIVAGVISFVYSLTAEQYEKNIQATKNAAIGEIFGLEAPTCREIAQGDVKVYTVYNGETHIGYCVESASAGFGGDVALMVGYSPDRTLLGVSVIAHSETPGLGAKVNEPAFLEQFKGQSGALVLGDDVDAISGATISSRAVTDGVNQAFQTLQNVLSQNGGAIR
jgi:electron transport complex protein RnfG